MGDTGGAGTGPGGGSGTGPGRDLAIQPPPPANTARRALLAELDEITAGLRDGVDSMDRRLRAVMATLTRPQTAPTSVPLRRPPA
jgi:hypothetical protein